MVSEDVNSQEQNSYSHSGCLERASVSNAVMWSPQCSDALCVFCRARKKRKEMLRGIAVIQRTWRNYRLVAERLLLIGFILSV